jgi:hypothetical protein
VQKDQKPKAVNFHADPALWEAVRKRASDEDTTVRAIMMRALKSFGFAVSDDDLDDKRKQG